MNISQEFFYTSPQATMSHFTLKKSFQHSRHIYYLLHICRYEFNLNMNHLNKIHMQNKIYPCLWFDGKAKEAADLYCSAFDNSKITAENPMVVTFDLNGQRFMGLNGGPMYVPNPSISFYVVCETADELDRAWNKFSAEGKILMELNKYPWSEKYGWIEDKFGISWQLALGKLSDVGQKFSPLLMFANDEAGKANEAVQFYTSLFKNSSIVGIANYGPNDGGVEGYIMHAQFKIDDYVMMAMDSSVKHAFDLNEGISIVVECATQEEIDYFWNSFTKDGQESQCGWLKDKYGVSWQIIPSILKQLMGDPAKSQKVVNAFMQMKKFDIEKLLNV